MVRFKLISGLAALGTALAAFAGLSGSTPAAADTQLQLPSYAELVQGAGSQTWEQQPGSKKTGPVSLVVHINKAPLAMVGRNWNHQQRVDYVKQIRAEQDKLVPQITALGGTIKGRFAQLSSGLAVKIDASKVTALRALGGVLAVHGVGSYALDLSETVPWIGARAVQLAGNTGKGIDVAVIDSGVDYAHKKLGGPGTVAAYNTVYCGSAAATPDPLDPACSAHTTAPTASFYGDPTYGRGPSVTNKVVGGYDWVENDSNPIDFEGHGTHVADIIAGLESAPGANDVGVAPGANIWGFTACSSVSSSCDGLALLLSVDDAMDLDDSDYGNCTPGVDAYCLDYDPADVINMSLGSPYGQPEDDLTLFTNIASYYGSLPVVSAGNSGDRPYIVGSPSTANGALSVAASTIPSLKLYKITAGSVTVNGLLQSWSPPIPAGGATGPIQYGVGTNKLGCTAFPAGSLAGKMALLDRGTCAVSIKGASASAAGAVGVIVADTAFGNTPPSLGFGGGTQIAPVVTVTQKDGNALKALVGTNATLSPSSFVELKDDLENYSSRGPRISDNSIKPEISAPSSSTSAVVGSGDGQEPFGGTSGAAPMIAGAAALVIKDFENRGLLDSDPGLDGLGSFGLAATPLVKAVLMNTANSNVYIGGGNTAQGGSGFLAPITGMGSGRVDAAKAVASRTIAWDSTELQTWTNGGGGPACQVFPQLDVLLFTFFGVPPECAAELFGNALYNAWTAQGGAISFGYDGVSATSTETRKIAIYNSDSSAKTYNLSTSFRYLDDKNKGVSVAASPASVTVNPGQTKTVDVKLTINAKALRDWTLDAGKFGASGTNITCNDPNPDYGCPTLTMFEYDGFLTVNGGANNTVKLPWQVLPKKAAKTSVQSSSASNVKLRNVASYKPGDADVFGLVDISPNNCEVVDGFGDCITANYVPGILPGINATAIDIKEVGVRAYSSAGLNSALGLPAAPAGAINDQIVDFGLTVYDGPYRASHNYPVEFDIYVDSNSDGVDDYVVFNADRTLNAADGRNAVFVADVNPADGTRRTQPYFYSFTDFNSQNWILPVPAAAIGVTSNAPMKFYALAFDAYFTGSLWDCSPFACGTYHTVTTGLPKYQPVTTAFQVKTNGSYTLPYSKPYGGSLASPSQKGLLFMYRDAEVGKESDAVMLP